MELINKETAIKAVTMLLDEPDDVDLIWSCDVINNLRYAPTVDAVEVVRCKTCKHWDNSSKGRYVGGWCFCDKLQFSTSPDWYCADGEVGTYEGD